MDQPGLIHHNSLFHDETHNSPNTLAPPKISIRSMSKSDPHLNIPHLLVSQDEEHPSLNRIVSGLFHVNNALRTPASDTLEHHLHAAELMAHQKSHLINSDSSAALLAEPQQPSLRKSSSAIDWNGAVVEATRKNSVHRQFDWQQNLFDPNSRKQSFSQFNQLVPSGTHFLSHLDHHHTDGGLVMSSSTERKDSNTMNVVASQLPASGAFSQVLAASSTAAAQPASAPAAAPTSNPLLPAIQEAEKNPPASHGMFGGMFHRGFFSRPVIRSDEEQYRYIMALDR